MIEFLVTLLVLLILVYAVNLVLEQLALPAAAKQLVLLLVAVVVLLVILDRLGLVRWAAWR